VSLPRGRAGGAVLPPDGPPTLLHPCLHEGYNRTYRRLSSAKSGRAASPRDLVLLGRCAAVFGCCKPTLLVLVILLQRTVWTSCSGHARTEAGRNLQNALPLTASVLEP
jgi:hypothetical protein